MTNIYAWTKVPLTNENADSGINWLEGTQLPSTVNNSARMMMARIAEFMEDLGGLNATGGTANAQTVTLDSAFTALGTFKVCVVTATLGVTGAATFDANGTGAKPWHKYTAAGEVDLQTGDVIASMKCINVYSSAAAGGSGAWILLNPATAALNAAEKTALLASAEFTEAVQDVAGALFITAGDLTWTYSDVGNTLSAVITANAVTNAKLADMATATFKGRTTAGTGDPEDLTVAQAAAMLPVFTDTLKGLVPLSGGGTTTFLRADGTFAVVPGSGTPLTDGDKGDITVSGGGLVWAIDPNVVTYAKMQDVSATDRLLGRDTAGAGDVEELTVSGGIEFTGTGIQGSAYTGDVTKTAGGTALTIAADAVTYGKMQNASATQRVLGRNTAGAGDFEEVTTSQILTWLGGVQGAIAYQSGAATWAVLAAGTAGYVLQTGGAAANPSWSKRHSKLNVDVVGVGNVGAGEDDLITYSLPANTLLVNGDGVRITAWGTIASNANAKTIKMYWGTEVIKTNVMLISVAGNWRIEALIFRRAANAQEGFASIIGSVDTSGAPAEVWNSLTQTDTSAITIKCTGTATTTNDIIQHGLSVEEL